MNRQSLATILVCAFSSLANYGLAQQTPLLEYAAEYEASANGIAATASRRLNKIDENSYRLSNSLEASVAGRTLATLNQTSEFTLAANRVMPLNYSYQLNGLSRASHAIFFNWETSVALSTEGAESWQLPLHQGVLDQLSYQVAMRQTLLADLETNASFSFEIIDGDDIEAVEFRLSGEETITTPLGDLRTVKLERIRDASDERVTEIWLAVEWDFLLTRIEQLNNAGLRIVLELKSAEIDGVAVRANF